MKAGDALRAGAIAARNLVAGTSLISLRLALRPRQLLWYVNESLFLYRGVTGSHGLPERNVFEVLGGTGRETISLGNFRPTPGQPDDMWLRAVPSYTADIVSLCLLCRLLAPRVVFEIGTLRGYTTLHLALNTPPDARIFTLDLPKGGAIVPRLATTLMDAAHAEEHGNSAGYCFDGTDVSPKITCLFGDSATFDYAPWANRVDLFFIDGAHSFEYVRSDTLKALACCHPGSVIAWHDFGRMGVNGVSKWLTELSKQRPVYAVPGGSLAYMVVE